MIKINHPREHIRYMDSRGRGRGNRAATSRSMTVNMLIISSHPQRQLRQLEPQEFNIVKTIDLEHEVNTDEEK